MYAWWCSLCVWEKGEVFATESTAEELFATDTHGRSRTKSSLSLSVRVCEGPWPKKTKTRLLTLINAKVQCLSLAGLRTQGREPCGSALRGDFPVGAPGYLLSRLWLSERFTVKAQLCSKAGAFQKVATPIVNRSESPEGRALKAAPAVLRLLPRAKAIGKSRALHLQLSEHAEAIQEVTRGSLPVSLCHARSPIPLRVSSGFSPDSRLPE